jgi:hypothetical protein
MMNRLRNRARPRMIWFDGVCAVPSAWRRIASTMRMRVNEVIVISAAGTSVSTVMSSRIWMLME